MAGTFSFSSTRRKRGVMAAGPSSKVSATTRRRGEPPDLYDGPDGRHPTVIRRRRRARKAPRSGAASRQAARVGQLSPVQVAPTPQPYRPGESPTRELGTRMTTVVSDVRTTLAPEITRRRRIRPSSRARRADQTRSRPRNPATQTREPFSPPAVPCVTRRHSDRRPSRRARPNATHERSAPEAQGLRAIGEGQRPRRQEGRPLEHRARHAQREHRHAASR